MADAKRLFVGVRVSVATANSLSGAVATLARRSKDAGVDIRWVAPVNYHVTLKFLGATRAEAVPALRDALEIAVRASAGTTGSVLAFRTARLGGFPALDRARVLWAGIEGRGSEGLSALAAAIETAAVQFGFRAGEGPFLGHVTLGRLRETRPLRELVLPIAEQMFGETRAEAVSLFESEIKPTGSVYTELARIPLKTASDRLPTPLERQTSAVQVDPRGAIDDVETDDGWPRGQVPNPAPNA